MLVPETEIPATAGTVHMPPSEEHKNENFIGAIARGTIDGGALAFNVAIMLISFLALVGLLNASMTGISNFALGARSCPISPLAERDPRFFGAPVAWLIGIPWNEARRSATCWERAPCSTSSSPTPSSGCRRHALAANVFHCDVCAVRVRQSGIDRHADRRHWSAGAQPPQRSCAARLPRYAGRDDGQPDVREHCLHAAEIERRATLLRGQQYTDAVGDSAFDGADEGHLQAGGPPGADGDEGLGGAHGEVRGERDDGRGDDRRNARA